VDLYGPIKENCELAVAEELRRVRNKMANESGLEIDMKLHPDDVFFDFKADNGRYGYETSRIYIKPIQIPPSYLVLAYSSTDRDGNPIYNVAPVGLVKEINPGKNTLDIVMQPSRIIKTPDGDIITAARINKC